MPDPMNLRCPSCNAVNRIPVEKIQQGLNPVCGRCKAPLPARKTMVVNDANFASEVEQSSLPVLVDMWAEWCGPCRMVGPVVDQLASEMAGKLRVAKLNVDENPQTASRFAIQSIPALLLFKGGQEIDRLIGAQSKGEILRRVSQALAA